MNNQVQEIIVYRNPAEQYLWQRGLVFPIMCAMAASVLAVVIHEKIATRNKRNRWDCRRDSSWVNWYLVSGGVAFALTLYLMV